MNHLAQLKAAGLSVSHDAIDVAHVRLEPGVPARIRRFIRLIREVSICADNAVGVAAARLIGLDAVAPSQLPSIVLDLGLGLDQLYSWRGSTHVEWSEETPPRLERRALSPLTVRSIIARQAAGDLKPELIEYLNESAAYQALPTKRRLDELERDAFCWWYQSLPLALFFHVTGLQPLSALSRECLAREETKQLVARKECADTVADDIADAESCAEFLDTGAMSEGSDESPIALRQALALLQAVPGGETDAITMRRWVGLLLRLRNQALTAGPINSLLLAWLTDMLESGTVKEERPSRETPKRYFSKCFEPLHRALRELPSEPSEWSLDLLLPIYEALIDEETALNPGGGSARTMATALSNFHAFLSEWFDVPRLHGRLHKLVPVAAVRAHVVWPHELSRACGWINQLSDDPQVRVMLKIVLGISREAAVRSSELLLLRIGNFNSSGDLLEVEIAPSRRWGRLKTPAAKRRLYIVDSFTRAQISSWIAERRQRGASNHDLLFADPLDSDKVYRRHHVASLVSKLLKAATGNPAAVGHDLRHSVISFGNEAALACASTTDINRLADSAVEFGHVSARTSLVSYTHVYEAALRQWLDSSLANVVPIQSDEAVKLTNLSAVNLRQRASRRGISATAYAWQWVREQAAPDCVPAASSPWDWTEARPPAPFSRRSCDLPVSITLLILSEIARRSSAETVAQRFNVSVEYVKRVSQCGLDVAHEVLYRSHPRKYRPGTQLPPGLQELLDLAHISLSAATVPKPKFEKLVEWLNAPQDFKLLDAAARSWLDCLVGDHLSLDRPGFASDLLIALRQARVDPRALRICCSGQRDTKGDQAAEVAEEQFVVAFGMRPRTWGARSRTGTPSSYLQWDAEEFIDKPHAASGSLDGLMGWMFAAATHVRTFQEDTR